MANPLGGKPRFLPGRIARLRCGRNPTAPSMPSGGMGPGVGDRGRWRCLGRRYARIYRHEQGSLRLFSHPAGAALRTAVRRPPLPLRRTGARAHARTRLPGGGGPVPRRRDGRRTDPDAAHGGPAAPRERGRGGRPGTHGRPPSFPARRPLLRRGAARARLPGPVRARRVARKPQSGHCPRPCDPLRGGSRLRRVRLLHPPRLRPPLPRRMARERRPRS